MGFTSSKTCVLPALHLHRLSTTADFKFTREVYVSDYTGYADAFAFSRQHMSTESPCFSSSQPTLVPKGRHSLCQRRKLHCPPHSGVLGISRRSLTFSLFTFLIAHLAPVSLSVASLTIPKLPCPNILPKVQNSWRQNQSSCLCGGHQALRMSI